MAPADRQSFTLIEVTVAIALFGLVVVVLTQAFVNTLLSLDSIESETALQADLRFVRTKVIKEPDLDTFEEGGEIETLTSGTARWEAEVESTNVSDLFQVELEIEIDPPEGERKVFKQHLILLRPTWSDPVERSQIIAENRDRLMEQRLGKDWQLR